MRRLPRAGVLAFLVITVHAPVAAQTPVWTPLLGISQTSAAVTQMTYDLRRQRIVAADNVAVAEHDRAAWRASGPGTGLSYSAIAYDPARHVTVAFGGSVFLWSLDNGTREWDGASWTLRSLPVSPPPRLRAAMAFDRSRGRMVLFGGRDANNQPLADTWEYDGATWIPMPVTTAPPPRGSHLMTFDVARGVTLLHGGNGAGVMADTWEWNGAAWTQFASGPAAIPAALVYDEPRARTVLTYPTSPGGGCATWERVGTTWVLQQGQGPITNITTGGTFDAVLGRVVTYGWDPAESGAFQLWSWDGASWLPVTANAYPSLADGAASAWCPLRQSRLLFGAPQLGFFNTDVTWEGRGGGWSLVPTTTQPPLLIDAAMATEPGGTVLLFGGRILGAGEQNTTWRFTGTDWVQLAPANAPAARSQHGMTLDVARNRIVLFGGVGVGGGQLADTWEWDGATWQQRSPAFSPTQRANPAMTFDPLTSRVLMFGGGLRMQPPLQDCYGWDGTNWFVMPSGPSARGRAQMDFDPVRGRTVLAGGFTYHFLNPTVGAAGSHEWDGTAWTTISATQPAAALGGVGGFDPALSRYVWFGLGVHELGAPSLAAVAASGAACAGSSGAPLLEMPGQPRAGNPHFAVRVVSLLPGTVALLGAGNSTAAIPLGGGCTLHVDPSLLLVATTADHAGVARFALPLPAQPALHGATFHCQGAAFDPQGALANVAVFSNALTITID